MGAEWFNCCAALFSFSGASTASIQDPEKVLMFQNTLIRLFSMLHAAALGELEDIGESRKRESYCDVTAFEMDLIDVDAVDEETLDSIRTCDSKVELIYQWIQDLIVAQTQTKNGVLSIDPPILTRAFQEFGKGMTHFHDALAISKIPFPFPYVVTCDCLLVLQAVLLPFVVVQWCTEVSWAVTFAFVQQFTLWTLNLIAVQLENPFGKDPNDIDSKRMQHHMNGKMRLLFRMSAKEIKKPKLREGENQHEMVRRVTLEFGRQNSIKSLWHSQSQSMSQNSERSTSSRSPRSSSKGSMFPKEDPASRARSSSKGSQIPTKEDNAARCAVGMARAAGTLTPSNGIWEPLENTLSEGRQLARMEAPLESIASEGSRQGDRVGVTQTGSDAVARRDPMERRGQALCRRCGSPRRKVDKMSASCTVGMCLRCGDTSSIKLDIPSSDRTLYEPSPRVEKQEGFAWLQKPNAGRLEHPARPCPIVPDGTSVRRDGSVVPPA